MGGLGSTPPPYPPTRAGRGQLLQGALRVATGHGSPGTCTYDVFGPAQGDPRGRIRTSTDGDGLRQPHASPYAGTAVPLGLLLVPAVRLLPALARRPVRIPGLD